MPNMISPRFALTEAALRLLLHARAHIPNEEPTGLRRPRIAFEPAGISVDRAHWRREAAFLRILSVTESYVDALSAQRFSSNVDMSLAMLSRLVEDVEVSSTSSWRSREEAYKFHHGMNLSDCARWKDVQAATQVRNALAHGLGRLTARQRKNMHLASQVAYLDVTISGGRFYFGAATLAIAAAACEEFVRDVDARFPA